MENISLSNLDQLKSVISLAALKVYHSFQMLKGDFLLLLRKCVLEWNEPKTCFHLPENFCSLNWNLCDVDKQKVFIILVLNKPKKTQSRIP